MIPQTWKISLSCHARVLLCNWQTMFANTQYILDTYLIFAYRSSVTDALRHTWSTCNCAVPRHTWGSCANGATIQTSGSLLKMPSRSKRMRVTEYQGWLVWTGHPNWHGVWQITNARGQARGRVDVSSTNRWKTVIIRIIACCAWNDSLTFGRWRENSIWDRFGGLTGTLWMKTLIWIVERLAASRQTNL